MKLKRLSDFCDNTLSDVVADLRMLQMSYLIKMEKAEKPEDRERFQFLMSMIDKRIAEMKEFFGEVGEEVYAEYKKNPDWYTQA
jgi:hypothetical protein